MTNALTALQQRRSVGPQRLGEPGPGADEIETLLTVAARVPDHGRLVPWRFLVIEGEARHRIGEAIAAAFSADQPGADAEKVAFERNRLARAPLVIAVVSRARSGPTTRAWTRRRWPSSATGSPGRPS